MSKKLTGKALAKFEAKRNVWQEVLDGVREIKTGKAKQSNVEAKTYVARMRFTTQLCSALYSYSTSRTGPLHHYTVSCPLDRGIRLQGVRVWT